MMTMLTTHIMQMQRTMGMLPHSMASDWADTLSVFDRLNRMFADEKTATAAQDRDGTSGVADSLEACHIDVSQRSPDNPH
jgi:hypothetical protein